MARKNFRSGNSSIIQFDSRTNTVMAQSTTSHSHVKQKVDAVREVVPGRVFDEIVLVLQYYDYNSEKAIQAYLEDGAKEALQQWHFSGTKIQNKKKKSRKGKNDEGAENSDGNKVPLVNSNNNNSEPLINGDHTKGISDQSSASVPSGTDHNNLSTTVHLSPQPQRNKSHHKHSGHHPHQRAPPPAPKDQNHGRHRTVSECSTTSLSVDNFTYKKAGLEKCVKDLQRQTVSLERFSLTLNSEMDRGPKKIKSVFEEVRKALLDREIKLITEFEQMKLQSRELFTSRQHQAADLKVKMDKADSMSDHELAELRADVKHFVSERRLDEDLAKTTRFMYDTDHIIQEIKSFGEVIPIKQQFSTRRPSTSSISSTGPVSNDHHHHRQVTSNQPSQPKNHLPTTTSKSTPDTTTTASANGTSGNQEDNDSDEAELTAQDLADLQQRLQNSLRISKGGNRNRPKPTNTEQGDKKYNNNYRRRQQGRPDSSPRKDGEKQGDQASPKPQRKPIDNGPRNSRRNDQDGNTDNPRREGSGRGRGRNYRGRGRGGGGGSPNKDALTKKDEVSPNKDKGSGGSPSKDKESGGSPSDASISKSSPKPQDTNDAATNGV